MKMKKIRRGEAVAAGCVSLPSSTDDAAAAPEAAQASVQRISTTDFSCIRTAPIDMLK